MKEDMTCDYSIEQPRCGRRGFREVWKKSGKSGWNVLCYRHFVQEKNQGHLFAWGSIETAESVVSKVVKKRSEVHSSSNVHNLAKLIPMKSKIRKSWKLGLKLTTDVIESDIEKGQGGFNRNRG